MKHMLDKLSGKPDDEEGDQHAHAKMAVLHELRNMAMGMMGDKLKDKMPMHEVDVQAPDRESLQAGLGLAQHLTGPHDADTGPTGPPHSLDGELDKGYGETLDSKLPHKGSNGSPMDHEAGDVEDQTSEGRSEPSGDEGEPDQHMLNPHRNQHADNGRGGDSGPEADDMYDDMNHDDLDEHIKHLQGLKSAKMMKR